MLVPVGNEVHSFAVNEARYCANHRKSIWSKKPVWHFFTPYLALFVPISDQKIGDILAPNFDALTKQDNATLVRRQL